MSSNYLYEKSDIISDRLIKFLGTKRMSKNNTWHFNNINPLSANIKKWSNTIKQFVDKFPTNCLSVFDHFVGLALKGLTRAKQLLPGKSRFTKFMGQQNNAKGQYFSVIYRDAFRTLPNIHDGDFKRKPLTV